MQRVGGCERCLTPKVSYKELQCSHYIGRTNRHTRWSEDNCIAICGGCHLYLEHHPHEHRAFFERLLGDRYDLLIAQSNERDKPDIAGLLLYYREKLKEGERLNRLA